MSQRVTPDFLTEIEAREERAVGRESAGRVERTVMTESAELEE
jgi:hypothetical protein